MCAVCAAGWLGAEAANDLSFVSSSISSNTMQTVSSLKFITITSILAVINIYCQLVLGIVGVWSFVQSWQDLILRPWAQI